MKSIRRWQLYSAGFLITTLLLSSCTSPKPVYVAEEFSPLTPVSVISERAKNYSDQAQKLLEEVSKYFKNRVSSQEQVNE